MGSGEHLWREGEESRGCVGGEGVMGDQYHPGEDGAFSSSYPFSFSSHLCLAFSVSKKRNIKMVASMQ